MLERTFSYAYNQTLREAIKEGMIKKHGTYDPKRLEVVERQYQKAGAVQKLPFSKVAQKVVEYAKNGNIVADLSCGTEYRAVGHRHGRGGGASGQGFCPCEGARAGGKNRLKKKRRL